MVKNIIGSFNSPLSLSLKKALLVCGLLSSLLYIGTDMLGTMRWEGYSQFSQTVSELIAIGAPTRTLVAVLFVLYSFLVYAFGAGVWSSAGKNNALRLTAVGLVGKEVLGLVVTLFFPIHLRGIEPGFTDVMHGTLTMVGNMFMLLALWSGAAAFGNRFAFYSVGTSLLLIVFGVMAGIQIPNITSNLPTPWLGIWERINIFAYMLWVMTLAVMLLQARLDCHSSVSPKH